MNKKNWIKFSVMTCIFVAIFTLDLVTKYVFDAALSDGQTVSVIPYLFNFKLVHNYGAAWGLLAGKQVFLIVLTFIFLAIFVYYYIKEPDKSWLLNVTFGFIFAGCIGNLYDRIFFGYVRDFIQFDFWQSFPVFNFADAALTIGVVLFVIYIILFWTKNRKTIVVEKPEKREEILEENTDENFAKKSEKIAGKNAKKNLKINQKNVMKNLAKNKLKNDKDAQKSHLGTQKTEKNKKNNDLKITQKIKRKNSAKNKSNSSQNGDEND